MRLVKSIVLGAAVLVGLPAVASAQPRPIHVTFGGGPTFVAGVVGDHFSTGWGPAIGVSFDGARVGFQFEYAFRRFHSENIRDSLAGVFTAHHDTHQLDFNLTMN